AGPRPFGPPGLLGSGLIIGGGDSTVRGLVINSFTGPGITLASDGNHVEGNYIGTNFSGTAVTDILGSPLGNFEGVLVLGYDNTIGGTTPAARNVISGNVSPNGAGVHILVGYAGNKVQGNFIGTDVYGTTALGNTIGVCINGYDNLVGGEKPEESNLISGN